MSDLGDGGLGRDIVTVKNPDGVEYRIVTARRATPLRGTSITSDFSTLIMEFVFEGIVGVLGRRSPVRKVGVFEVRPPRPILLRFKARLSGSEEAQALVAEIADEIQRGELRWERQSSG